MGAPTEIYVDPAINANSGTGTIGDPYGDLQYALDTATRDATNGNRFNIKAGTAENLAAAISLTTYGSPTQAAPLIFQGYTSAANDGGIGDLNGGGTVSVYSSTHSFLVFRHLKARNVGNRVVIGTSGSYCLVEGCEISDTSGSSGHGLSLTGSGNSAYNNYLHDLAGNGMTGVKHVAFNTFKNGATNKFVAAIDMDDLYSEAWHNLIVLDGASHGILWDYGCAIMYNSIFSSAGTGSGIKYRGASRYYTDIIGNLIEGFSGAGGKGIDTGVGSDLRLCGFNRAYNCTTAFSFGDDVNVVIGTNSTLGASPFTNAGSGDFTPVAAVQAIAYPTTVPNYGTANYRDLGAIQHEDAGSGGGGGPLIGGRLVRC